MTEPDAADAVAEPVESGSRMKSVGPFVFLILIALGCVLGVWPWIASWNAGLSFHRTATLRDKDGGSHLVLLFRAEESAGLVLSGSTTGGTLTLSTAGKVTVMGTPGAGNAVRGMPSSAPGGPAATPVKTITTVKPAVISASFPLSREVRGYVWSGWRWRSSRVGESFAFSSESEPIKVVSTPRGDALTMMGMSGFHAHVVEDGELVKVTGAELDRLLKSSLAKPTVALESETEAGADDPGDAEDPADAGASRPSTRARASGRPAGPAPGDATATGTSTGTSGGLR